MSIIINALIASAGRIINVILGIIMIGLISRYLGVTQYGLYALLLSYGAILATTSDFGLYLTLTRLISQFPRHEQHYLSRIVSLRLILLLVTFSVGAVASLAIPSLRNLLPIYFIAAVGFSAQSLSQLMMGVYQKHGAVWRASIGDLIGRLAQIAGILFIGAAHATLASMVALFTVSLAVAGYFHRRLLPSSATIKPVIDRGAWRKILSASWPLGALLIFNVVYFRIDTIMLSIFSSPTEVGLYGLAYRLIESGLFFPAMLGGLLLPRFSEAWHQQDLTKLRSYFQPSFMLIIWVVAFITIVLWMFSAPIISLIAGPSFSLAAPLLKILGIALAVMFIGNLAGFTLVACQRQKTLLTLSVLLAVVNIVANLIFIPHWGASAAAFTTLGTEVLAAFTVTVIAYRLIRFKLSLTYLLRLALVSLLTILTFIILPDTWHFLLTLFLGGLVYYVGSIGTHIITKDKLGALLAPPTPHG
jgi:O-antigen/teichoic acid export membrane protein